MSQYEHNLEPLTRSLVPLLGALSFFLEEEGDLGAQTGHVSRSLSTAGTSLQVSSFPVQ